MSAVVSCGAARDMVIAQLTTDNRQDRKEFGKPQPWFGTAPEALLQGFSRIPDVRVHVISCIQERVASPEKLAGNIWFHSLHVPKIGWLRTGYQGCIRAVRRKLREIRPDIVHGQGTERDCAISAVMSGFPNVITIHGNMRLIAQVNRAQPFTYAWLAARLEAFTAPRSDGVVCITQYTEQAVRDLARRTWVAHNAVDDSFFQVQRTPSQPPTILCVGNITLRKNQNALIESLDRVAAGTSFNLLFLGAAPENDEYARRFRELIRTRSWCRYGGVANRDELKRHLADATGVVLPSLEDNCPMVVLEAMAAGVPVAASRVGGVPELITHEQTGLLFDPANAAAISQAVRRLLVDAQEMEHLARTAKDEARIRFHPERIAQRHLAIYREVLSNRS
jgi:glycosyltransferase involved in cell wall biosynthesis